MEASTMTPLPKYSISVFVQAPKSPRSGWNEVRDSIEQSDIGTNYQVVHQSEGQTMAEHFLALLDRMAQADTDLVLRLEDDVDVNRHILYNLSTWPALDDARFGVGWAFDPGGSCYTAFERKWRKIPTKCRWTNHIMAYSLGTLMYRKDITRFREGCAKWFRMTQSQDQDIALSDAVLKTGKLACVHAPSLLEHRVDFPSLLGHKHTGNRAAESGGAFFKTWRRGDPVIDQYGRIVERG
jgi:hypothetical protein